MMLFEALVKGLSDHPDAVFGTLSGTSTAGSIVDDATGKSRVLKDLLGSDQARVAIIRRNSPAYVSDLLGVLGAGHVPVLMDPALGAAEIATLFADCGIDAVLHDDVAKIPEGLSTADCAGTPVRLTGRADPPRPELAPGTELCRLTSGSTRTPACVEFSGTAVLAAARAWLEASELGTGDRILCFAGLYNGLAFNTSLIPGILSGASLFLPAGLPGAGNMRRHLESLDATVLVSFPAAYDGIVASGAEKLGVHRIRLALSSAARLAEKTSAVLAEHSLRIADYYGIAETGPLTFNPDPAPGGGQGYPLPGVSLRIGEGDAPVLLAKSRSMGTRYLNYPGELESRITEDGYYRTSDQGELSSDGELRLGERLGNSFSVGGRKFSASEVEDLLDSHPAVAASAAALVTPDGGGRPFLGAVVVPSAALDVVELRRYCIGRSAPFKVPERIVLVEDIPRNGAGKVQTAQVERRLRLEHETTRRGWK
jgi:acyl-CoA synthetase (AMP-forming)/AMP-acid ligase II